jgi:hypothetical protein
MLLFGHILGIFNFTQNILITYLKVMSLPRLLECILSLKVSPINSDDRGSMFLRNVGILLPRYLKSFKKHIFIITSTDAPYLIAFEIF